jgi:hypothetical protein
MILGWDNGFIRMLLCRKGSATVCIGSYLEVLRVLGLQNDFSQVAKDDILGRKLQNAEMTIKKDLQND